MPMYTQVLAGPSADEALPIVWSDADAVAEAALDAMRTVVRDAAWPPDTQDVAMSGDPVGVPATARSEAR